MLRICTLYVCVSVYYSLIHIESTLIYLLIYLLLFIYLLRLVALCLLKTTDHSWNIYVWRARSAFLCLPASRIFCDCGISSPQKSPSESYFLTPCMISRLYLFRKHSVQLGRDWTPSEFRSAPCRESYRVPPNPGNYVFYVLRLNMSDSVVIRLRILAKNSLEVCFPILRATELRQFNHHLLQTPICISNWLSSSSVAIH